MIFPFVKFDGRPIYINIFYTQLQPTAYTSRTKSSCNMSIKDQLTQIERYLIQAKIEDERLEKGVKSAAPKLRASLLEIGKIVSESRKAALDAGKAIATKKRAPKGPEAKLESKSDPESEELPEGSPVLERHISQAIDASVVSDTPSVKSKRGRRPKLSPAAV